MLEFLNIQIGRRLPCMGLAAHCAEGANPALCRGIIRDLLQWPGLPCAMLNRGSQKLAGSPR